MAKKITANRARRIRGSRGTTSIRVSDAEMRRLDAAASLEGVSRGSLLREAGLERADSVIRNAGKP